MNEVKIGQRIREERKRLNMTQEQLAEDVDLTTAYIGLVERGERNLTLDNIVKVANRLGVTVDYLLIDSIDSEKDPMLLEVAQLFANRTNKEKALAVNLIKTLFSYLHGDE